MLRRLSQFSSRRLADRLGVGAGGASAPSSFASASSFSPRRYYAAGGNKDYYKILGVSKGADTKEVKKAYRKRALETHPDQGGSKEEFAEVAEAYEVLSSPEKRQIYDQYGSEAATNPNMGGPGGAGGFGGGRSAEDIFAEFFRNSGMGGFGDFGGGGGGMSRGHPTVQPIEMRVRLTLEEVYRGVNKTLRVTRPQSCGECSGFGTKSKTEKPKCTQCNGAGHVVQQHRMGPGMVQQTIAECPRCRGTGSLANIEDQCGRCHGKGYRNVAQDVSIDIPAGVPANVTLVVRGEGGTIPGAVAGDLHVQVEVSPHRVFQRRGDDLIMNKELSLPDTLLGTKIQVKLLDGRTVYVETTSDNIPKPEGVIKVPGEGMPNNTGGRGDVYIFTRLTLPNKLSASQKELLSQAFGMPKKTTAEAEESTKVIKGRVLRESREQLEEQKRGVWSGQESGGAGSSGGARRGRQMGGGPHQTECAAQ